MVPAATRACFLQISPACIGPSQQHRTMDPIFNNQATYAAPISNEFSESTANPYWSIESCLSHVTSSTVHPNSILAGGGQPHLHGDPFSDQTSYRFLYGPSNYSSVTSHPPVIGFPFDGHLIYGRYLSASSPGFAAPLLDACGGHKHTNTKLSTTGPIKCWKADLSAQEGSSATMHRGAFCGRGHR